MAKYKIPYPLVEVIWDDAASNTSSWVHIDDIATPERVNTTGFLVKEEEGYITVANSVSAVEEGNDTVGNTMTIPKGMIISRREVRIINARRSPNKLHPKSNSKEVHREQGEG